MDSRRKANVIILVCLIALVGWLWWQMTVPTPPAASPLVTVRPLAVPLTPSTKLVPTFQPDPRWVDMVKNYLLLFDINHDGKLEVGELKKMSILEPA